MKDLTKMSAQDVLDTVWNHFIRDGAPFSIDEDGDCAYRGNEGACCAVGLFIPDEKYSKDLEGDSVAGITTQLGEEFFGGHESLLQDLQSAHDYAAHALAEDDPKVIFADRLKLVAEFELLTVPAK